MSKATRRSVLAGGLGAAAGAAITHAPMRRQEPPQSLVSVSDFGAVGDRAADDTAALQAALDAAEGKTLWFDDRTYVVSDVLTVRQGTTLRGNRGTTIMRKTGYHREILGNWERGDTTTTGHDGNGNIVVDGITFDGNAATEPGNMVVFVHCRDVTIRDCVFLDCTANHHLELNSTRHAQVSRCKFLGFRPHPEVSARKEAIQIDRAHPTLGVGGAPDGTMSGEISIESCYFGPDHKGNRAPNIATGTHNEAPAGNIYDNLRVLNCVGEGLNMAGTRWVNTHGLRVIGNEFTLSRRPEPVAYNEAGALLYGFACTVSTEALVADNRLIVEAGENAISVDIRSSSPSAQVSGNMLQYGRFALFMQDSDDCNFRGNDCLGHTEAAVHLRSTLRAHVSTNTFRNSGANGGNVAEVEGSGDNGEARWNSFESNIAHYIGSGNQPPGVGVICDVTSSGTSVRMNRFRNIPTIHEGPDSDIVAYNDSH